MKRMPNEYSTGMGDLSNYGSDKAHMKQVIGGAIAIVLVMALMFFI